ncbi:MAG: nucleoside kinase [Lachnospiraceae bacterium]|jgi:uridine kinase
MEYTLIIHGEKKIYGEETTYLDIAEEYRSFYQDEIVLVRVNNALAELFKRVDKNGTLEFVTVSDKAGRETYRRSVCMMMESAASKVLPGCRIKIQNSLGQGLYCEVYRGTKKTVPDENMISGLKSAMSNMAERNLPVIKSNIHLREARKLASEEGRNDRVRLLRYRRNSHINIYELDGCKDYYYGYMVPSTGYLKYFDIELYKEGFMLMFPDKDTKKTEKFKPADKLYGTLAESTAWAEAIGVSNVGDLNDLITKGKMLDLILVQESWMEKKMSDIAEMIANSPECKFVMIAGPSSSGKTTFSHRLSVHLMAQGFTPHQISLDDFYVNREDTPLDENGEYDYECLEALDIELFNEDMRKLLEGEEVILPIYNFKTGKREFRNRPMKLIKNDILVIEGIHGLNEKLSYSLPKENKFKIYISALTQLNVDDHNPLHTTDARLLRRIVRDARTRNTTAAENIARWKSVREGEEKNIFPFQEEADVMFNSALIYELPVMKVYAEPLLFSIDNSSPEYEEAKRLLKFLDYFLPVPAEDVANNSILREFIGGSCF